MMKMDYRVGIYLILIVLAMIRVDAATSSSSSASKKKRMPYLREADLSRYLSEEASKSNNNRKMKSSNEKDKTANDIPGQWMSVSENVEYMPNTNLPKLTKLKTPSRKLEDKEGEEYFEDGDPEMTTSNGAWEQNDPYSVQPFVEGMSEYDEYQQAWRLLGFMIDCNLVTDDDGSGSGSEDVTEDGCTRYILWAAYVDLEYEGGGIGEYQYWDQNSQKWNDTACYYADAGSGDGNEQQNQQQQGDDYGYNNNDDYSYQNQAQRSRCAKMDCHMEDTHFNLLGFFKHKNYDDWMEQLFKHEGMCVWTKEEYAFMKGARKVWPQGCVDSGTTVTSDESYGSATYNIYYNVKPMRSGRIGFGLYTDSTCVDEYPVTTEELEEMIGNFFTDGDQSGSQDENFDFSGDTLEESMDRWNSAWDVWHTCHPCVAYDIENLDGNKYLYDDDDYWYNQGDDVNRRDRRRKLGGEYNAEGDVFECYDDAGYTNVNQCMKFSAKTAMRTATFRDLSLGRNQATLVQYPLSGFFDEHDHYSRNVLDNFLTYFFLALAVFAFFYSLYCLYKVGDKVSREGGGKKKKKSSRRKSSKSSSKISTDDETKKDALLEEEIVVAKKSSF